MHAINYEAPSTLDQAVSILKAHGENARPFCGGTDLIIQLRAGVRRTEHLVDIKKIKELRTLSFDAKKGLRLGAAVPCIEISESDVMRQHYPGLTEAAHLIGSLQIQNRASVGGNLCNGSPAADTTPALIALGARARIVGPVGEREVPVESFVVSPGRTVLKPGEMLVELLIPAPAPHSSDAYLRFIPRNEMDIAVVGVGASVTLDGDKVKAARIGLGAVAATPLLETKAADALIGKKLDDASLEAAGRAGERGVQADRRHARDDRISSPRCRRADAPRTYNRRRTREKNLNQTLRHRVMKKTLVEATINGETVEFLCEPRQSLLETLRDVLELTGSKEGCLTGDCGACTVMVDGRAIDSCLMLGVEAQGKNISTVEGLATQRRAQLLQKKFLEHASLQCGICTPGFLISAKSLLDRNPKPTEPEVRYALAGNLCRCTGYDKIVKAVLDAAADIRSQGEGKAAAR